MPHRANHLFPRTELANSLPRSFDTVKVASTEGFPSEPGFMVRIEGTPTEPSELVTVTKIAGNKWTVKRAAEGSTKVYHPPKAEVELFPVRYEQQGPFARRAPQGARQASVRPTDSAAGAGRGRRRSGPSNKADHDKSRRQGARRVAPQRGDSTKYRGKKRHDRFPSETCNGTVVAIESDSIQIKRGTELWQLALGRDLRSMTRVESGSGDDSAFSGYSDDAPDSRGGESRGASGRDRFRSRRIPAAGIQHGIPPLKFRPVRTVWKRLAFKSMIRPTAGPFGEVTEWPIVLVSKTSVPARVPRVRIPASPLSAIIENRGFSAVFSSFLVSSALRYAGFVTAIPRESTRHETTASDAFPFKLACKAF